MVAGRDDHDRRHVQQWFEIPGQPALRRIVRAAAPSACLCGAARGCRCSRQGAGKAAGKGAGQGADKAAASVFLFGVVQLMVAGRSWRAVVDRGPERSALRLFSAARRLAIQQGGATRVYDTGDHMVGGVWQQQSGDESLTTNGSRFSLCGSPTGWFRPCPQPASGPEPASVAPAAGCADAKPGWRSRYFCDD